ncbi:MAG: sigma-70 family RNA polymerase sigma factor [Leptolyngbyaceae cyanobacterium CSU_1_3]|nr:sigma-70 family RNA polymerase sigma factor [Leptolyngbyaceae cyanobacterium CSU_1_3]
MSPFREDDPDKLEEAALLVQIAQKDQAALSQLYDRYARIIHAIAYKSLGSREECEEVVLDVFAQIWRTSDRYDPERGRVDTWVFMLARSRILDRLRSLQRAVKTETASIDAAQIQSNRSSVDPIEDALVLERREVVLAALSKLPDEQRQVIELAYYRGLSQSEIATQVGISLGTVKTRIRLGLSKLRIALGNWE